MISQGNGTIGAISCTNVDVVTSTELECDTGGWAVAGTWALYVTTAAGTGTLTSGFTYDG